MKRHFFFITFVITGMLLWSYWNTYLVRKKQPYRSKAAKHKYRGLFFSLIFFLLASWHIPRGHKTNSTGFRQNIMVMLDVSQSMLVTDLPNQETRLSVAKQFIHDLLVALPQKAWGLGIFAGEAQAILPITSDANLVDSFLQPISYKYISTQGTNLIAALNIAAERFANTTTGNNIILLISDGGEESVIPPKQLKEIFLKKNISIIVVGIGTQQGGPIANSIDISGNLLTKQRSGQTVISKINETALQQISQSLGGMYATRTPTGTFALVSSKIRSIDHPVNIATNGRTPIQQDRLTSFWALCAFLSLIYAFLPWGKRSENGFFSSSVDTHA